MRDPSFWWRPAGALALALSPFAMLYGLVAAYRMRRRGTTVRVPVVCVGNFTLGGAGKTPAALAIGHILQSTGHKVFFLSRGYGGKEAGPLLVDATRHAAAEVGDEPLLLARLAPTIVSRERVAGAELACELGASVIIMDDGFQNPSLIKNFSLAVIDGFRVFGNGRVFPAGPLRAPLHFQLRHAHALLFVGKPSAPCETAIETVRFMKIPALRGWLKPDAAAVSALRGARVLAFAGIGNPEKFYTSLAEAGIVAAVTQSFPDHHRYTKAEAEMLVARAQNAGLALVTTEKDLVRLARDPDTAALAKAARALPVTLQLDDEDALRQLLAKAIA